MSGRPVLNKWLFLVVLTFGLGAGVALSQFLNNPITALPELIQSDGAARAPVKKTLGTNTRSEEQASSAASSSAATDELKQELEGLLAAVPIQSYEQGSAVIRGTVVTTAGNPLEGCEVTAVIWGGTPGVDQIEPLESTLEQYLFEQIDQYNYDQSMLRRATTGADGEFVIEGLRDGADYQLQARKKNWLIQTHEDSFQHVAPGESRDLVAFPTAPLTLNVIDPSGASVHRGWTIVGNSHDNDAFEGNSYWNNWLRSKQTVDVQVGFRHLYFQSAKAGRPRTDFYPINLRQGEPSELTVVLRRKFGIFGNLVSADGILPKLLTVSCRQIHSMGAKAGEVLEQDIINFSVDEISQSYSGEVPGPGRYELWYQLNRDEEILGLQTVEVTMGFEQVDWDHRRTPRSEYILASVVDESGQGITGCEFRIEGYSKSGSDDHGNWKKPQGVAGRYRIEPPTDMESFESFDSVRLFCRSTVFGSQQMSLDVVPAMEARFEFQEPAFIVVELADFDDHRVNNLLYFQVAPLRSVEHSGAVGDRQIIRLGPRVPGHVELQLMQRKPWNGAGLELESRSLTLQSGDNIVPFACPDFFTLTVRFPHKYMGADVGIRRIDNPFDAAGRYFRDLNRKIRLQGEVVYNYLSVGSYMIEVSSLGEKEFMNIELKSSQAIDFKIHAINAMRVIVTDSAGVLSHWGLASEDLIYAINGKKLANVVAIRLAITKLFLKGSAKILLERNGKTMELNVHNEAEVDFGILGGDLLPASRN